MHDHQVSVLGHQRGGRAAPEIDVGLIDDDHRIGTAGDDALDGVEGQDPAGRGVGVRKDDAAIVGAVIVRAYLEIRRQRHFTVVDAVKGAIHRVEAVGDVGKEDRLRLIEQTHEDMGQHFVRAVADEHLARLQAMSFGDRRLQAFALGIRIQPQPGAVVAELVADGRHHLRRWRVGALVGIEFDQPVQLGLLARNVGRQAVYDGTPVSAHLGAHAGRAR